MNPDDDMDLVRQIRRDFTGRHHEYLSKACAHRDHSRCDQECDYCQTSCQCVCHRWVIAVEPSVA